MARPLSLAVLSLVLIGPGSGATAQNLSGADLLRELSGNTLTGFNGSLWFSEYHAPDGRVLGHNGQTKNHDACWTVRGDAVCYYYPRKQDDGHEARAEFCWHLARAGSEGYRIGPVGRPLSGIARLDPGNSRNHTDNGKAWTCNPLMSRWERRSSPALGARSRAGPGGRMSLSAAGSA